MHIYLNGSIIDQDNASVSVSDRGFIFGDGVYEVIRAVRGQLFMENEHLSRMEEGLAELQIPLLDDELHLIPEVSRDLLKKNDLLSGEATVYIQITRGAVWPRTHTFPETDVSPTVYISTSPFEVHTDLHEKGVNVITLPDLRWARCNLKTVNLLPNVLARQQAVDAGVNTALMIRDGMITESPNANIFGVRQKTLFTYPVSNYILKGITRQLILEIAAKLHIPAKTIPIQEKDLFTLDELFLTGTTTDIQPVIEINGRQLADGKPGPVVKMLQEEYRNALYGH